MALPSSGAVSLGNYNTELEYSSTAQISLNDTLVRNLNKVYTGANSLGAGYGLTGVPANGCVLYLDAGNPSSYPGSGQSWYDISGAGNHFSWASSPSYTSGSLPYFSTLGNIATGPASNASSFGLTSDYTVIMWIYQNSANPSQTFRFDGSVNIGRGITAHTTWTDGVVYWDQGGCCGSDTRTTYSLGTSYGWVCLGLNRNTSTTTRKIWVNGSAVSTNNNTAASISLDSTAAQVGNSSEFGNTWDGRMSTFLVYNRSLTDTEMGNMFTATRGRFGV